MKIKSILKNFSTLNFQLSTRKGFTQHHLYRSRKRDYLFNLYSFCKSSGAGFTLIELLIVIAILGVLAAGILVAIDPVDKINAANDSRVQSDISGAGRAAEAYAAANNGLYPETIAELAKEIKSVPVGSPNGTYTYTLTTTSVVISGSLKSKKFTSPGFIVWRYRSSDGTSCAVKAVGDACP